MRKHSVQEKKFKIKDPNFIVNEKRLIIRNIPLSFDAPEIKRKISESMSKD